MVVSKSGLDSASISWNEYTDLDSTQFEKYIVKVKKRYVSEDEETPMTVETTENSYSISGLESAMDYEIWVSVYASDFGQSEWSESVYLKTDSDSNSVSDLSEIDQLRNTIVRVVVILYVDTYVHTYKSIFLSFRI